jgi:hypothetical protein
MISICALFAPKKRRKNTRNLIAMFAGQVNGCALMPSNANLKAPSDNHEHGTASARLLFCRRFRHLHHVRPPEEPIHAHVEVVGNFSEAVNVKRSQTCEVEIDRGGAKRVRSHPALAAGRCKVLAEKCEI